MVKKITKFKILRLYLNNYNKKYYLREMASLLKKPHQTIKPHVEELNKEGILIKNKRKNIIEYSLNFKNKKVYDYLIISEKEKLIEKLGKNVILSILFEKLSKHFEKNTFIIFGSSTKHIRKGSDIDLLVIGKKKISKEIKDFEEIYNKKIHKIQTTTIDKLNSTLIKEVYKKHLFLGD